MTNSYGSHRWLGLVLFSLIFTFGCEYSGFVGVDELASQVDTLPNQEGQQQASNFAKWDDSCLDENKAPLSPFASHIDYAGMYPAVRASKYSNFFDDWEKAHNELKPWGNTIFIDFGFTEHFVNYNEQVSLY